MKKALLVIDMLNDFIRPDGALSVGATGPRIVARVRERIEACRREGGAVISVCDSHAPDDAEFRLWPAHAVAGSEGAEIIPELGRYPPDFIVPKKRYSAFYDTRLDSVLKDQQVGEVEVTGVCTSICVLFTVQDCANRGIPVRVIGDGVADFDQKAHAFALKHMERILGAVIV